MARRSCSDSLVAQTEGAKFWLQVPAELKRRGLEDILICCTDGLAGFSEAITTVFPQTLVRLCIVHMLRNSLHMCPGMDESAGKRKSGRTGQGNRYLRTALVEAAVAASRQQGTYLQAQYHRLVARRGRKRAIMAVGHSILVIAYPLLRDGAVYQDLGANYFDEHKEAAVVRRLARRLQKLGYEVALTKRAA